MNDAGVREYERTAGYQQALIDAAVLAFAAGQHDLGMAILELQTYRAGVVK